MPAINSLTSLCLVWLVSMSECRDAERKQLLEDVLHGAVEKRKAKLAQQQS